MATIIERPETASENSRGHTPLWQNSRQRQAAPSPPHPQHSLFALLDRAEGRALWIIFGVALLLRLAFLETVPSNVTADELDFAGNTLQILHGGGPGFFGLDWTQLPAASIYLISWSWQLFGATIFAERLVSALLTALAIFPFHALLRRVMSPPAALAATVLFAASRWYLHFSRSGWTNGHVVLYMLLAAWLLTRALEGGRWRDWCGFGGALALLLYGYSSGRIVILACFISILLTLWQRRRLSGDRGWRRILLGGLVASIICTLLFAPELRTISRNVALFNQRTSAVLIFNEPRSENESLLGLLGRQTWTTIHSFILMDTATGGGRYKGPQQAWLDPVSAILYIGGLLLALRRGRAVMLWWSLLLLPLGLTQILTANIPDGARGLIGVAPMYFFVALTLDAIFTRRWARRPLAQGFFACCIVGIVALNVWEYGSWMALPQALAVREPAVSSAGFYLWRDFQIGRLEAGQGIMSADEYNALPAAAIAASVTDTAIAARKRATGTVPPLPEIPLHEIASIGVPGETLGQLSRPHAVAVDRQGYVYVADSFRDTIVRFAPDGRFMTEWPLIGATGHPCSIIVAADGTIIVLAAEDGMITRYDRQGGYLGVVSDRGGPTIARGMAMGADGNLYIAATGASTLFRLDMNAPGAPPPSEQLRPEIGYTQPTAVIAEADGAFIVYEPDSNRLRGFTADGQLRFTQLAPRIDTLGAGNLALLGDGRILLADPNGRRLLFFAQDGTPLGQFAMAGTPQGLAVTSTGDIAVADTERHSIHIYAFGDQP